MPACSKCGFESDRPFRFCPECGAEPAAAASHREQRKVVTVLFCDLTASTALGETLDPEPLRALLARYFERMKAIIEQHGGTVEKFIGDAVMAVFGVPVLHEDDALRAVRAAAEMRNALPDLGLQGRIGVMTGEVVTGTEERLATGDAVNVAARLEQAAQPGDVLLGEPTLTLVRDSADVEAIEPLHLKGKTEPVPAYRLLQVHEAPPRRHGKVFVGREHELATLLGTWKRVAADRRCELITVVGDAGVGKSRLSTELLDSIDASAISGRCLPYGEGISYWPVLEVLKQIDALPPDETVAAAMRSLLGETEGATSGEEIAWAFRKTLEHAATQRALVVIFDDIQWAEDVFLDLIEHVALLSTGASILLVCIARPEFVEHHPTWPVTLRLEPLADFAVDELIPKGIRGDLRDKIARAAGGNPLFIQEMLAMAGETQDEVVVPLTLRALLAARLDQLGPAERSVLERGSIEGEIFHLGAVQALAPDETHVTPHLAALVRKELIRPDTPQFAGEDGLRFRHLLIRDAAYDAMPKATRADLHERFARWLEEREIEFVEQDEIIGYHLERACRYRDELGTSDDGSLSSAARRHLKAGGRRAFLRQDYAAAASLFERASALLPSATFDLALENELNEALFWMGRDDDVLRRATDLSERAASSGDRVAELCAKISLRVCRINLEAEGGTERLTALVDEAMPVFEAAGDDLALYIAYSALAELAWRRAKPDAALEAHERAFTHAERADLPPPSSVGARAACRFFGATPVSELLAWLDEHEARAGGDYFFRAYRAGSLAMLGRFDEARKILATARAELTERGGGVLLANITAFESVWLELWAGDPAAAVAFGAEGFRLHEEQGGHGFLSQAAGNLAQSYYALDQLDEAARWAGRSAELGASEDIEKEMLWRRTMAKVLARRGEQAEGERLAREAVAFCDGTEVIDAQGDVYADFAEVLALGGHSEDAVGALDQALARYDRKGNDVMAERVRTRLKELRES